MILNTEDAQLYFDGEPQVYCRDCLHYGDGRTFPGDVDLDIVQCPYCDGTRVNALTDEIKTEIEAEGGTMSWFEDRRIATDEFLGRINNILGEVAEHYGGPFGNPELDYPFAEVEEGIRENLEALLDHRLVTWGGLVEALAAIAEGKGRFSRDPLTHAENTIEDMKALAVAALAAARQEEETQ